MRSVPIVCTGSTVMPGVSIGRRNIVRPLCFGTSRFVRVSSSTYSASWAMRRPHLATVDDPLVAVADRARRGGGDVAARVGLAVAERHERLAGEQDRGSTTAFCMSVPTCATTPATISAIDEAVDRRAHLLELVEEQPEVDRVARAEPG